MTTAPAAIDTTLDPRSAAAIATLLPAAQRAARRLLAAANDGRLGEGIVMKIICGTRSYAEQTALYAQGRTAPGPIVTDAPAGYSNHNFGIAFDVGILREGFGFRCDSDLAQLAALRAGVGIGGCQENIAKRDPDLRRLLADSVAFSLEVWLVMHEDVRATPRIRLLFDHLARGLTEFVNGR